MVFVLVVKTLVSLKMKLHYLRMTSTILVATFGAIVGPEIWLALVKPMDPVVHQPLAPREAILTSDQTQRPLVLNQSYVYQIISI